MYYEINVSDVSGQHLFATAKHSVMTEAEAKHVWNLFMTKFPKSEGYSLKLTRYEEAGTVLWEN